MAVGSAGASHVQPCGPQQHQDQSHLWLHYLNTQDEWKPLKHACEMEKP